MIGKIYFLCDGTWNVHEGFQDVEFYFHKLSPSFPKKERIDIQPGWELT